MMIIIKWVCFILVCTDVIGYIVEFGNKQTRPTRGVAGLIGMFIGTAARVFLLYGTATYWLL